MKLPPLSLDDIQQLDVMQRVTIPEAYKDENNHMNVRHYLGIFDDAGYPMIASFGLTPSFHEKHGTGGFDLEHHIHFLNEVLIGDSVTVYLRVIARSAKRIHYMMFMVNDTRQKLAAVFECVNSFADLSVRKTAPYPPEVAEKIDTTLARHQALAWDAPICGIISA
jgi:acyl-CoA thioester hydrolase